MKTDDGISAPGFIGTESTLVFMAPNSVRIGRAIVCNTGASSVLMSFYRVPAGAVASDVHSVLCDRPVGARGAVTSSAEISEITDTCLGPGDAIYATSSIGGCLAVTVDVSKA